MNWRKFSEERPDRLTEILFSDGGVNIWYGLHEWFKDYEEWPEHVKPIEKISGKWIETPVYWMYLHELVVTIPKETQ